MNRNFRTGLYPVPLPHILGVESEGIIVSTSGDTHGLKAGDRVVALGSGTYAEYSIAPASKVAILPLSLAPGLGAASIAQGLTALIFITKSYPAKSGEWIMVQGATGGVGLWLCQLLRGIGARVIGTASKKEKVQLVKDNGAEFVVDYVEENVENRVMEITSKQGVSAVFDTVGLTTFQSGLKSLARDGTFVLVGNSSGNVPPFNIGELGPKNLKLMKPTVYGYLSTREEFVGYMDGLLKFLENNGQSVKAMLHEEVYSLAEAAKAHADFEGRRTKGKLLLKI